MSTILLVAIVSYLLLGSIPFDIFWCAFFAEKMCGAAAVEISGRRMFHASHQYWA